MQQSRHSLADAPAIQQDGLEVNLARVVELIFGRWRSQIVHAGVKLGVFDALAGRPGDAGRVAGELAVDAGLLYRLMRALGTLGLLKEDHERIFCLTDAGELLRRDHPHSLRAMTLLEEGAQHYLAWRHLPDLVQDGMRDGRAGFVREFGEPAFAYAVRNPAYGAVFNDAMTSFSAMDKTLVLQALETFDFSRISHLCDVAGGHGYALCSLLAKYRHLRGTVLELPAVVGNEDLLWARKMGLEDRCAYVAGDMFQEVPRADAYMLKRILHDWDDEQCVRILSTMHRAAPRHATLLIMEQVVPGPDTPHFSKLFDIHMLVWGGGLERTEQEYAALLDRSGWTFRQTRYPPSRMLGVVEAVKQ